MLGLLMLMLLQCDADSACPPDDNPLELDPPHLVVRHGDPLEVNCTSREDHDGMYWTNNHGIAGLEEKVQSFVIWKVDKLTDWDVQAQCNVKINQTHECSKDFLVTVYKNPDSVTLFLINGSKPLVEGSEYQLQCDVLNVAPVRNLKVRWFKGNETIDTNSFSNMTKTPVDESLILKINLSREDNGVQFKCEALLDLGPEGLRLVESQFDIYPVIVNYKPVVECESTFTVEENNFTLNTVPCQIDGNPPARVEWYHQGRLINASVSLTRMHSGVYEVIATNVYGNSSDTIDITVEYAPEFQANDNYYMSVAEGSDVSLHCGAEGNPSPEIQWWFSDNVNITGSQSTLNITEVTANSTYNCKAFSKLGIIQKQFHIHVRTTTAPVITTTPGVVSTPAAAEPRAACPPELSPARVVVRYGDPVSVNCSTSSTDIDGMGWEASHGGISFKENVTFITWTVASLTIWTIKPKCYIVTDNDNDPCVETPLVTVYKVPDVVSIFSPNHTVQMVEGSEYQLKCDIINVAPVQNLTVKWYKGNETIQTDSYSDQIRTPVNVSSTISVTLGRTDDGAEFRCEAQLDLGPEGPLPLPGVISNPYITTVHYAPVIDCPSDYTGVERILSLSTVPCQADGNPPPMVKWYHQGMSVNPSMLLSRMESGQFIFEALNVMGRTRTTINITVEYGPTFTCLNRYEVKENERNIECKPEGKPEPQITWFKGGKKVPFPVRFTRHNGGRYTLIATNNHGNATHMLEIDILYAPEFQNGNDTVDVTSGNDASLSCSAEGNPPPELNWTYTATAGNNMRETTERRQRTILIKGATSTNAGVYVCTATNKVGTATRSITLIVRDYTIVIISVVVAAILLVILIPIIICCYLRQRHGHYNFLPVNTMDMNGSNIPLTPLSANGHTK